MKHSEAPWTMGDLVEDESIDILKGSRTVAVVVNDFGYSAMAEVEANARLIKEAPAMFKALQDLDGLFFDILNEFSHKQQIQLSTERIAEFAEISAGALARATNEFNLIRS